MGTVGAAQANPVEPAAGRGSSGFAGSGGQGSSPTLWPPGAAPAQPPPAAQLQAPDRPLQLWISVHVAQGRRPTWAAPPPGLLLAPDSSLRRAANCRWASGATAAAGAGLGGRARPSCLCPPRGVTEQAGPRLPAEMEGKEGGNLEGECSRSVACAPLPGSGSEAFACNLRKCGAPLRGLRGVLCTHTPAPTRVLCAPRGAGAPGANQAVGRPNTKHRGGRTRARGSLRSFCPQSSALWRLPVPRGDKSRPACEGSSE